MLLTILSLDVEYCWSKNALFFSCQEPFEYFFFLPSDINATSFCTDITWCTKLVAWVSHVRSFSRGKLEIVITTSPVVRSKLGLSCGQLLSVDIWWYYTNLARISASSLSLTLHLKALHPRNFKTHQPYFSPWMLFPSKFRPNKFSFLLTWYFLFIFLFSFSFFVWSWLIWVLRSRKASLNFQWEAAEFVASELVVFLNTLSAHLMLYAIFVYNILLGLSWYFVVRIFCKFKYNPVNITMISFFSPKFDQVSKMCCNVALSVQSVSSVKL